VGGLGSAKSFERMFDDMNQKYEFKSTKSFSGYGPSDHQSFYKKGVPVLFLFTGYHDEYHMPTDTVDKINFAGMKQIVDFIEDLGNRVASDAGRPEYVKMAPPKRPAGKMRVPTIGFAPGNYDESEEKGVLVGGVSKDGPAEKAGLKEGDYIVEIAGKPVKNMTGYMFVMRSQKRGEACDVTVVRDGKKVTLKVIPQ
jgi:S1-C subfamily serine protease